MRLELSNEIFGQTNIQRVFSFLAEDINGEFLAKEVQEATALSKAGVYRALDELVFQKLVRKHERGRFVLYGVIADNCVVRQFKVLKVVISLVKLVDKLKASSRKIVLFGSCARGEDYKDSDIDFFIVSTEPDLTRNIVASFKSKRKIQAVIKTAVEAAQMEEKDSVFLSEVNSGVVLWEEKDGR